MGRKKSENRNGKVKNPSIRYLIQIFTLSLIGVVGVYANAYFNQQDAHQVQLIELGEFKEDVLEFIRKASQSRWSRKQQIEFWKEVKAKNPNIDVPEFPPEIPAIPVIKNSK